MSTAAPVDARPRVVRARLVAAPAPQVWAVLGDLGRHGDLVPCTVMDAPARITRAGDVVTATTAGFLVDRMRTVSVRETPSGGRWARWATLRKEGPVLVGTAHVAVIARGDDACLALWAEDVDLRPLRGTALSALVRPALDVALAAMADLALERLHRSAESSA